MPNQRDSESEFRERVEHAPPPGMLPDGQLNVVSRGVLLPTAAVAGLLLWVALFALASPTAFAATLAVAFGGLLACAVALRHRERAR